MLNKIFSSKKKILTLHLTDWLFIFAALIVFSALVLFTISKSSVWFDEAFGVYLSRFNLIDIAKYTAADVHPPFYYWLLRAWGAVFGHTELGLRSMSLFFGCLSIVFGYLITNKLFNKDVARFSLIFMVLSPMMIRYSQEARMYTLVTAIALAATYVLTIAVNSKNKTPWIIYGVLLSLGMWTHYFTALVWLAHWIWRADNIRRVAKKGEFMNIFFSHDWLIAHIIAIALFVPWIPSLVYQLVVVQAAGFWISPVTPDTLSNFITNVVYYLELKNVTGWLALAVIVSVFALCYLAFKVYKSQDKARKQSYRLIIGLATLPVVLLFLSSMPPLRPSFVDRYLIPSTFGIAMFVGITLAFSLKAAQKKRHLVVFSVIFAGLLMFGIYNVWQYGNYNKTLSTSNNTRQIIEKIVSASGDSQPIIADSPWLFYEVNFYETKNHLTYFINEKTEYKYGSLDMLKYNSDHKIMDISSFAQTNPVVWYVGCPGEGDFKPPYSNWKQLKVVNIVDSTTQKSTYKAIQYQIDN